MNQDDIVKLLRSPGVLKPLRLENHATLVTGDGETFPIRDGIYCLLKQEEMGKDLGDDCFYEKNPFGLRDWSNPQEVEAGVEVDFKRFVADAPKDARIADVGAGTGRISNYLGMQGFTHVFSIDYSLNSLKMIQEHSPNTCVWGNNLHLPLADGVFDIVISTGVIHHTPDPEKAFAECARILKPGGRFYFKTRNIHSPYGYLFHTYGAALRFCEARKSLRFLSNWFGFGVYKLTRKVFYSHLPKFDDDVLRGKYENLFIKKLITFFGNGKIKKMIRTNDLQVVSAKKSSFTHRQHFYILTKPAS